MNRRGRPREFDTNEALAAAMMEFWKNGYAATSMADLSRTMRISSPSIYAAYGSKEKLFKSAVVHYQAFVTEELRSRLSESRSIFVSMEDFFNSAINLYTRDELPGGCFMLLTFGSNSPADAEIKTYLAQARWSWLDGVRRLLAQAIVMGELKASTPVEALALAAVATLQGLALAARDGVCAGQLRQASTLAMAAVQNWRSDDIDNSQVSN